MNNLKQINKKMIKLYKKINNNKNYIILKQLNKFKKNKQKVKIYNRHVVKYFYQRSFRFCYKY